MATKYKEMIRGATLTGAAASFYTAPVLVSASIHAASGNNPTGSAVTMNVYKVGSGGAADATTKLISKTVGAGKTVQFPELVNHKLEPGSQIYADGLACTLNVSGIEYTPDN